MNGLFLNNLLLQPITPAKSIGLLATITSTVRWLFSSWLAKKAGPARSDFRQPPSGPATIAMLCLLACCHPMHHCACEPLNQGSNKTTSATLKNNTGVIREWLHLWNLYSVSDFGDICGSRSFINCLLCRCFRGPGCCFESRDSRKHWTTAALR